MDETIKVTFWPLDNMHPTLPTKATTGAAAYDLYACVEKPIPIQPGKRVLIETGWKIKMPITMAAYVMPRSGLAWKNGNILRPSEYADCTTYVQVSLGYRACFD